MRKSVGILLFNDVEVLDFCGPFEVFSATRLNEQKRREEPSPFAVCLIAQAQETIVTTGGMKVVPECDLEHCPPLDILVIPGGWGSRKQMNNQPLLRWITAQAARVELVASVCTGALLLGAAGLLDGRRATTHWRALELLSATSPKTTVEKRFHVVEDGPVLTSAGISAGIDLALMIVSRYCGEAIGRATARHMEYPYPENNRRRIALD